MTTLTAARSLLLDELLGELAADPRCQRRWQIDVVRDEARRLRLADEHDLTAEPADDGDWPAFGEVSVVGWWRA